jgi:hypothetical protein
VTEAKEEEVEIVVLKDKKERIYVHSSFRTFLEHKKIDSGETNWVRFTEKAAKNPSLLQKNPEPKLKKKGNYYEPLF